MGAFSHIRVPDERPPTPAARTALTARLGFTDDADIQDWERHFADPSRLVEFTRILRAPKLTADERFLLMELILASVADAGADQLTEDIWQEIAERLVADYATHAGSIWFWASVDEETGIPLNDFAISRRLQQILLTVDDRRRLDDGTLAQQTQRDFRAFWIERYPGHDPVGYRLRKQSPDHWVRFHSLPDTKHYPEDDRDITALLTRQNAVAADVLGEGESCWLVASRSADDPIRDDEHALAKYDWSPAFRWLDPEEELYGELITAHAAECLWLSGQADDLLLEIAQWQQVAILWVSQTTGGIFAPYDGGMDVILPRTKLVDDLRRRFADWLSPFPNGL